MNITRAIKMALLLSAVSCSSQPEQTPQQDEADAASRAEPGGTFTREQFAQLRWLEGDWRGGLPDGRPFYERYRVTSDSTIHMTSFGTDETMTQATDSSRMYWRDGHIYNGDGAARSVVARIDSAGVHFVPDGDGGHRYTWKQTADGWTATLRPARGPRLVYEMQPVK